MKDFCLYNQYLLTILSSIYYAYTCIHMLYLIYFAVIPVWLVLYTQSGSDPSLLGQSVDGSVILCINYNFIAILGHFLLQCNISTSY